MENNWFESTELIKKDFNNDRDSMRLEEQQRKCHQLVEERLYKFRYLEK